MKKFNVLTAVILGLSFIGCSNLLDEDFDEVSDAGLTSRGVLNSVSVQEKTLNQFLNELDTTDANAVLCANAARHIVQRSKVTYTQAPELARLVQLGYQCYQTQGPISVTKAKLVSGWTKKDVYVIALSGTDVDAKGQTTGLWTDFLSGFEFDNKYTQNIVDVAVSNLPRNANIILTGHSLGGMVAQQVAANKTMKDRFNILNTVTFGSPLIDGFQREGTVKRLGDSNDLIPYASVSTVYNVAWQSLGLNKEDGGYGSDKTGAHTLSYQRSDVWGAYDVTGTKKGGSKLEMDFSTTVFYPSSTK